MTNALGVLLAAVSALPEWLPTVSARLDRAEAHVGDAIPLRVTVIHAREVSVNLPTRPDLGDLLLLGARQSEKDLRDGRIQTDFVLEVAAYDLGDQEVPPIDVVAVDPNRRVHAVSTEPLPFRIASLLANVPDPKPEPAAPPVRVMERDQRVVWAGIVIVASLLGIVTTLQLRRWLAARACHRPGSPPEPPEVVALRRLEDLRTSDLLRRGDFNAYYERLSLVVRDYVGGRYGFAALDMTTREIRDALVTRETGPTPAEVEAFLSSCDLVKFARYRPGAGAAEGALDAAVAFIERTRPVEVAPAT